MLAAARCGTPDAVKLWRQPLNDLKKPRGRRHSIAAIDGLKGFPVQVQVLARTWRLSLRLAFSPGQPFLHELADKKGFA
jgi:hypothetical protein